MFSRFILGLQLWYDVAESYDIEFQDPATPIISELIKFHDELVFWLIWIVTAVFWILVRILFRYQRSYSTSKLTHGTTLEIIWTLTPALILVTIAYPSFQLLYLIDEVHEPLVTLKAIGHQWYWSYEYSDYNPEGESISFDSYIVPTDELTPGDLRLLEVDHSVVVPTHSNVRVLVSAADVLHSWAVPSLGIKLDAVPGRLNQAAFYLNREGSFYGQCSEICGFGHAFMPIVIQGVSLDSYISWLSSQA